MHPLKRFAVPSALLLCGLLSAPASALPGAGAEILKGTASASNGTEQVRHRCYRDDDGDLYCPRHGYRTYYNYSYVPGFSLYLGDGGGWRGGYSRNNFYRDRSHIRRLRRPESR